MAGPSELLECSWGRIRLFASQIHTDSGRTQVVHELSSGDRHPVQDRGLRVRRVRVNIQFDVFPGAPAPRDAAIALERAKDTGQTAVFQHPLLGRYVASIGEFVSNVDESSVITAEAEFIQEDEDIAVTPTGAASSGTSGEDSVDAAATAMDAQLAAAGQLKISGTSAVAVLSRTPGGSKLLATLNTGKAFFDMTVASSTAFALAITNQVTTRANGASGSISRAIGAPVLVQFGAFGAAASLSALALSPFGQTVDVTSVVPAPSGFGESDPSSSLAAAASSDAQSGLFAATTLDARVAVASWNAEDVPTRTVMNDAARISNNIAIMIEVGGFELDISLWQAFRAAIMLGEAVRAAAIAATSDTPSVFVMRVVTPTALLPMAARIYGGANATERARQIAELNDISTPGWLAPGDYLMPTRPAPPPF